MISTMWTLAPAGARGPVGLVVRAAACAVESPVAARLRAVPAFPIAQRPGTRVPGIDVPVLGAPAIGAFGTTGDARQLSTRTTTQHDGTTLGIHSSGRPLS